MDELVIYSEWPELCTILAIVSAIGLTLLILVNYREKKKIRIPKTNTIKQKGLQCRVAFKGANGMETV